jgi:hypothetical protein
MTVPQAAKRMHNAFELATLSVMLWHTYKWGAILHPDQFTEYWNAANDAGDEATAYYFYEYQPALIVLLFEYGLSEESLGFSDSGDATPSALPQPTKPSSITPQPTKPPSPPTPTPSMKILADSQADFTGGQGQNSWEYLFSEGRDTFNWKQMGFDGSCWRSPFQSEQMRICPDHGAPGAGGDIAWLYKAEQSGRLVFKVTAKKSESQGDDIEIKVYRHTTKLQEWDLNAGDTQGLAKQFELDVNGGEMFFFTLQVDSTWREFKYDPTLFRVQVYAKE